MDTILFIKTLMLMYMNLKEFDMDKQLTLHDKVKSINIKINIDRYDVTEICNFISHHIVLLLNDFDQLLLARELNNLNNKLFKKLNNLTEPKSIRLNYYEIQALTKLYKIVTFIQGNSSVAVEYPQVNNILINKIWCLIPSSLKE